MTDSFQLKINPRAALWFLLACVGLLTALHILGWIPELLGVREHSVTFVDMTWEKNIPTLFSSVMLITCGVLCLVIALAERGDRGRFPYWLLGFLAFVWIGVDEVIMFHEYMGDKLHARLGTTGFFRFAWVIPYGAIMLVIVAAGARFFFSLPKKTKIQLATAAIVFVTGGMGLEMVGAARFDSHEMDLVYHLINLLEEVLELIGVVLFIHALLDHLAREHPGLTLSVSASRS